MGSPATPPGSSWSTAAWSTSSRHHRTPQCPIPASSFLGDDEAGRATEVIEVEMQSDANGEDHLRVIHAMALREKYRRQYEEAKRWRV